MKTEAINSAISNNRSEGWDETADEAEKELADLENEISALKIEIETKNNAYYVALDNIYILIVGHAKWGRAVDVLHAVESYLGKYICANCNRIFDSHLELTKHHAQICEAKPMRYPDEETLAKVKNWHGWNNESFHSFMAYLKDIADWYVFEQKGEAYFLSTGGWSGNEDVIYAMMENHMFWMMYHYQSRRGGHYIFAPSGYDPDSPMEEKVIESSVYFNKDCIFHYCPNPPMCKELPTGCQHVIEKPNGNPNERPNPNSHPETI